MRASSPRNPQLGPGLGVDVFEPIGEIFEIAARLGFGAALAE
jgi:hypothetical protein